MYFFCFTRLKLFRNNREWLLRDGLGVTNNVWLWRASHFQLSRTKLWKLFRRFRHPNYQNFAGSLLGILREVLKKNQNRDSRYGKLLAVEHSSLVGSYPAHNIWVHNSLSRESCHLGGNSCVFRSALHKILSKMYVR